VFNCDKNDAPAVVRGHSDATAKRPLNEEDVEADFSLFEGVVFQDEDFEHLYVPRFDQRQGLNLGMATCASKNGSSFPQCYITG